MDVRIVGVGKHKGVEEMKWVVTVYGCARLIDIRWFDNEKEARSFYAESLVRYPKNEVTITRQ